MTNINEVAIRNQTIPGDGEFQTIQAIARLSAASGLYSGVGSEPKILMVLLAARELGIPPMQALNGGIWNIQGKVEISARLMNSMIRKAGHSISITECNSSKCIMVGKRADNGDTFTAEFSFQEAQKAGLVRKNRDGSDGIWMKYAEDMLYARAMSRLARRLFPDVIGTAYVEGEIRDAKFEIVKCEEEPDPRLDEINLSDFTDKFPEEKRESIREYIKKYSTHWKKTISQTLIDYEDSEKFLNDFTKWELKQVKQVS